MSKMHGTVTLTFCGPQDEIEAVIHHMGNNFGLDLQEYEASNTHIIGTKTFMEEADCREEEDLLYGMETLPPEDFKKAEGEN